MRFRPWLAAAAVGLGFGPALLLADDPPKKADPPEKKADEPKTPAEKVAAVLKGINTAMAAFRKASTSAQKKDKDETEEQTKAKKEAADKARAEVIRAMQEAGPRLTALAKEFPADPAALDAIQKALQYGRGDGLSADLIGIVKKHHLGSPKLSNLLNFLMQDESAPAADLLKTIAAEATDPKVKGPATFALVNQQLEKLTGYTSQATKADYAELKPELEKQLDLVAKEYADITFGRGKLGAQVTQLRERLKKAESLLIGSVAPEIKAEDIDGKEFKLSDYRGKVVMLDFWGDW